MSDKLHISNWEDKSGTRNTVIRNEDAKNPHLHIAHNPDGIHMDLTFGNGVKLPVNPNVQGWDEFFKFLRDE